MINPSRWSRVFISLALVGVVAACGSEKVEKTSASRGGDGDGGALPGTNLPVAECNTMNNGNAESTAYVSSYYQYGSYVPDKLNMNLISLSSAVRTTDKYYLQFYRWQKMPSQINQIAVNFVFVDKQTGQAISSSTNKISRAAINNIISSAKLDKYGYTFDNFFQRAMIVLSGVDAQYMGLQARLVLVQDGQSFTVGTQDFLIPPFYVNPATFATRHPSIQTLHPFYSYISSGGTDADFRQMAEKICSDMVSDVGRLPASVRGDGSFWSRIQLWFAQIVSFVKGLF